jgi:type IV secretory pathway VirB2 component (pilin)
MNLVLDALAQIVTFVAGTIALTAALVGTLLAWVCHKIGARRLDGFISGVLSVLTVFHHTSFMRVHRSKRFTRMKEALRRQVELEEGTPTGCG